MKRLVGKILSLALIVTFVFSFGSSFVYAQEFPGTNVDPNTGVATPDTGTITNGTVGQSTTQSTNAAQAETAVTPVSGSKDPITPCGAVWDLRELPCNIVLQMLSFFIGVFGLFAVLSAKLFDLAVNGFILNIKTLFLTDAGTDNVGIYTAWRVIRDLCNVAAFFGAIYMGFRRMVGLDQDDFKKAIAKLAMFAILTNFSFPISKFIIDISNVVSLQAYGGIGNRYDFSFTGGVSGLIFQKIGLGFLASSYANSITGNVLPGFSSLSTMALFIIFLFFAFFVFIYAALMILVRAGMLLLSVVLSPLMFIGGLVPSLSGLHDWWRQNFIGQLVFGPIFMTMLWIAFQLLDSTKKVIGLDSLNGALSDGINPIVTDSIANMIMSIIFLIAAVYLSNKFSGSVGKFVGGAIASVAVGAATGGVGAAGRFALGRAGVAMQRSGWVQNKLQNGGALARNAARLIDYSGKRAQNAKVFGSSYRDKVIEKKSAVREGFEGTLRGNAALQDQLGQAKTKGEVERVQAQLRASNANTTGTGTTTDSSTINQNAGVRSQVPSTTTSATNNQQSANTTNTPAENNDDQLLKDNNVSAANSARFLELQKQKNEITGGLADKVAKEIVKKDNKESAVDRIAKNIDSKRSDLDREEDRAVRSAIQSGIGGDAVERIRGEFKDRRDKLDMISERAKNLRGSIGETYDKNAFKRGDDYAGLEWEQNQLKNTIGVAPTTPSVTTTAATTPPATSQPQAVNIRTGVPITAPVANNPTTQSPKPVPVQPISSKIRGVRDAIGNAAVKTLVSASQKVGEKSSDRNAAAPFGPTTVQVVHDATSNAAIRAVAARQLLSKNRSV